MILGLFSISYAGLWGQHRLDLEPFLAKAAALGYSAVMLAGKRPHLAPWDVNDEQLERLRAALAQHGLTCPAVAAYTDFSAAGAAEVPWVEMQIHYVEQLAGLGAALGARLVRVFTAYERDDSSHAACWRTVVQALRECADRCAAHGVTVAVQNHHDLAVHTEALLDLLAEIDRPNVRLAFDAWSPALRGEDLYAAARRAAPLMAMTTNADYVRQPRYRYCPHAVNYERLLPDLVQAVPFGEGFIDYPAFFAGLREGGFDGLANYEMCSPLRGGGSLAQLDRCAAAYLAWMQAQGLASPRQTSPPHSSPG
jgi:sugar phosphate isomerase/epimerase